MTKTKFSEYTAGRNGNRSIDEAISEIDREMQVRKRLFDKWVSEGRMSWVDDRASISDQILNAPR